MIAESFVQFSVRNRMHLSHGGGTNITSSILASGMGRLLIKGYWFFVRAREPWWGRAVWPS
jgi:hypothetical protein